VLGCLLVRCVAGMLKSVSGRLEANGLGLGLDASDLITIHGVWWHNDVDQISTE